MNKRTYIAENFGLYFSSNDIYMIEVCVYNGGVYVLRIVPMEYSSAQWTSKLSCNTFKTEEDAVKELVDFSQMDE